MYNRPTTRDEFIAFFENIDEDYIDFADPKLLDIDSVFSPYGLYQFSVLGGPFFEGPEQIPQKKYDDISRAIKIGNDLNAYEEEYVIMVKSGCLPGVDYFRWSSDMQTSQEGEENWLPKDEMLESFLISLEDAEPQMWSEMDEEELECRYDQLQEIKSSQNS